MAGRQPIVAPGRSTVGGYVYVIQFDSGSIKVGRTTNPAARLKSHAATARTQGVGIAAQWVSQPIESASRIERQLIGFCNGRFPSVNGGEYFAGVVVGDVLAFAETLESSPGKTLRMAEVIVAHGKNGRPEIGPKWEVRLDEDSRAQVEALVEKSGAKRADVLRTLIVAGLAAQ